MGVRHIVSSLWLVHGVVLVTTETGAGADTGAGEEYLEMTETKWDGKTPWFTGSTCECNGWATRCQFSEELFRATGRGGRCLQCQGNRDGPQCERCKENHYLSLVKDKLGRQACEPCDCHPDGSINIQCSMEGECSCKPGVAGKRCDQCAPDFWKFPGFDDPGCQSCRCLEEGSFGNRPDCDTLDGDCHCKQNVEGRSCEKCKSGYFQIERDNKFGCTPCFCYGHTSQCHMADGYVRSVIKSEFSRGPDDWVSEDPSRPLHDKTIFNAYKKLIGLKSSSEAAYFVAPPKFLGDQRASYNQELRFSLKVGASDLGPRPSVEDIIIIGGGENPNQISLPITEQNNPLPTESLQSFAYRLNESPNLGWIPRLGAKDYISIFSNITAIKIRGSFVQSGEGFIDGVQLDSAELGYSGQAVTWIEECECPTGYSGQFCQTCQRGYHHEHSAGPFARCVPCNCHGHSDYCDEESGMCDCIHNTAGEACDTCADGFYGNALSGTPDDCQPCPCPSVMGQDGRMRTGRCYWLEGQRDSPVCSECPAGRTGSRCELCEDGYFGDPEGIHGNPSLCQKCECNNNIDTSAIGNCDRVTGECLRCIENTDGLNCENCKQGFFGNALTSRKEGDPAKCQSCQCYPPGSQQRGGEPSCSGGTGECSCRENVVGHNCEQCKDTYWNIDSGAGCDPCNCDPIGSVSASCDVQTGRCYCRPGVTGQRCDICMSNHFGFSMEGCQACECDPQGSTDHQCDELTGQCPCRDKVEGRRCERCMENTRTREGYVGEKVCEPCEECYNLVQHAANQHRHNLQQLDKLLQQIAENPEPVGDDFEESLATLEQRIQLTLEDSLKISENAIDGSLREQLENLTLRLKEVNQLVQESREQLNGGEDQGEQAFKVAEKAHKIIHEAQEALKAVDFHMIKDGKKALRDAQERSRKFGEGSEKMSDIASKARKLSEQQESDAHQIEKMATETFTLSNKANQLARDALEEQVKNANQIQVLQNQLKEMTDKLSTVENLSFETLNDANNAYDEAISIYRKVYNLDIPNVETKNLQDKAYEVSIESERIKSDAQRLVEENIDLLKDTKFNRDELKELLNRAISQQQEVDNRLNDMIEHRKKGTESVALGNAVLNKAKETLETLRDFENRVNNNREAANKALKKTSEIRRTITQANDKTTRTAEFLKGTDKDSHLAISLAEESTNMANMASEKSSVIILESSTSMEATQGLRRDGKANDIKIDAIHSIVEEKKTIAARDAHLAADALREANKAQGNAEEATRKVIQAKIELDDILRIITTVEEPEPGLLDDLERRLDAAEKQYEEAGIEARLAELHVEKTQQSRWLLEYRVEIEQLTVEFESIEQIRRTLPDQCWNKIRLEP